MLAHACKDKNANTLNQKVTDLISAKTNTHTYAPTHAHTHTFRYSACSLASLGLEFASSSSRYRWAVLDHKCRRERWARAICPLVGGRKFPLVCPARLDQWRPERREKKDLEVINLGGAVIQLELAAEKMSHHTNHYHK